MQIAMENEKKFSSGMASNMVAGEPASPIRTKTGVTKTSCIDPKAGPGLDGFSLPTSMGDDLPDGECTGAAVRNK